MRPGRHTWRAMPSGRRPNKVKTHMLKDCSLPSLLVPINPNESDFTATKGAQCASCGALRRHVARAKRFGERQLGAAHSSALP